MKSVTVFILALLSLASFSQLASADPYATVWIANRASGTVSIAERDNLGTIRSFGSSFFGKDIEPMYVSPFYIRGTSGGSDLLLSAIADRKNDEVIFLDRMGGAVLARVKIGRGAFHQNSSVSDRLYVATDVDKGFDEVKYVSRTTSGQWTFQTRRFELPAAYNTGKPHDLIATPEFVYLTVHGVVRGSRTVDVLLKIDSTTFLVTGEREFSSDVHLQATKGVPYFVLLEQEAGKVRLIDSSTLADLADPISISGAHGVAGLDDASLLLVTNISAPANEASLHAISVERSGSSYSLRLIHSTSLPFATAHNIAIARAGGNRFQVFVTHSGPQSAANSSIFFDLDEGRFSETSKVFFTGLNPFGVATFSF